MKKLLILSLLFFSFSCGSEGLRVEKYIETEYETEYVCDMPTAKDKLIEYCEGICLENDKCHEPKHCLGHVRVYEDGEIFCKCKRCD